MEFRLKKGEKVLGHFRYAGIDEDTAEPGLRDIFDLDGIPDPVVAREWKEVIDANRVIHGGTWGQFGWDDEQPVTYVRGEHPGWFGAFTRAMLAYGYDIDWLTHMIDEADAPEIEERLLLYTLEQLVTVEGYLRRDGLRLRGVYLRNRYPDVQLVVKCLAEKTGREGTLVFDASSLDPRTLAGIVHLNILEGTWEWDIE